MQKFLQMAYRECKMNQLCNLYLFAKQLLSWLNPNASQTHRALVIKYGRRLNYVENATKSMGSSSKGKSKKWEQPSYTTPKIKSKCQIRSKF